MSQVHPFTKERISEYLRKHAPPSVVELGVRYAVEGPWTQEPQRQNDLISGSVQDRNAEVHTASMRVVGQSTTDARCTCCSPEDMAEQWCAHGVAVLWKAVQMELLAEATPLPIATSDSATRLRVGSPSDIASLIQELKQGRYGHPERSYHSADVALILDYSSDRLGIKLLSNGETKYPLSMGGTLIASERPLDNILYQVLDDKGQWDQENEAWYLSASEDIEVVLGLVREYGAIYSAENGDPLECAIEELDAMLVLEWRERGLDLSMVWIWRDGRKAKRESEILGTNPYWTVVDNVLYRISEVGGKIASLFPYTMSLSLTRSQVGPILEAGLEEGDFVEIRRPELQPTTEVRTPTPSLTLTLRQNQFEHFAAGNQFEVHGTLEFDYPTPAPEENVVYLPDREKEQECIQHLEKLKFSYQSERKRFVIAGDDALDLVQLGISAFPFDWRVNGIDAIQKSVRFANLSINLSMTVSQAALPRRSGGDWFDCHISLVQNNANVPISTLFKNARADTERWVRLDTGAYAKIPGGGIAQLKTVLGMLDPNFKLSNTIKVKLSSAQALGLSTVQDDQFNLSIDERVKALRSRLENFRGIKKADLSPNFIGSLREYQHEGVSWLDFLYDFELGGVLADEMGLGKTVQTLAFLQRLKDSTDKDKNLNRPALIVAPTSVIRNWWYEAKRFTPELKLLLLHGPHRKRSFSQIPDHDIVITSYALLRLDRYELSQYEFSYAILDEAQNIKNPQAATTKAAKALNTKRRLALSGTPTENRPMELWSIVDFLMPGYLGSYEFFRTYIERPILEGGPGVDVARFLQSKTKPFILRRTKREVEKDLPPKLESELHVEMTNSQRELYNQILEEVRPRVFEAIDQKGIQGASVSILSALLRLRQVCNHPNSISALRSLPGFDSGKFALLKELVEEALDSGRKILIFSQFREMLSIVREWIETISTPYLYLDGSTKDRQELIDRFNSDESVRLFLISLKAGGTGLNLTSADTVIIYDPWWNPAVEGQAVDRAHRIGQTKTVHVYRLVTENSVEQKIMDLKSKKATLVEALVNESGLSTLKLSRDDIEGLFLPPPVE